MLEMDEGAHGRALLGPRICPVHHALKDECRGMGAEWTRGWEAMDRFWACVLVVVQSWANSSAEMH